MPPSQPMPTSQIAIQYDPPNVLTPRLVQTAPVPKLPTTGNATLVKVSWASINPVDIKLGQLPAPIARLVLGPAPITPSADYVGRVWSTTLPDFEPGDLVYGTLPGPAGSKGRGTFAQYTLVEGKTSIAKVPKDFNRGLEEFAGAGVAGFTALQALLSADLPYSRSNGQETGGSVFINGGSGGVGTFTVQMAKHGFGCEHVVASCSGANADLVKSLGADEIVDYRSVNVADALKHWSRENGGRKFDAIIDNAGADHSIYWEAPHYVKAKGGKYIQIAGGLDPSFIWSVLKIVAWPRLLGGGKLPFEMLLLKSIPQEQYELFGRWMVDGKIRTVIEDDNRFDLADAGKALTKLSGGRVRGKIVLKVAEDGH